MMMLRTVCCAALIVAAFTARAQTTPFTTIPVGNGAEVTVADTVHSKVFVANLASNTVSVIDPVTWTKTADIATGAGPHRMRLNSKTGKLYVLNGDASVTVINASTNAIVRTIALPSSQPWDLVINETTNRIYVSLHDINQVAVIDGSNDTFVTGITVSGAPLGLCVNETTNRVYAPGLASNSVNVIDGNLNAAGAPISVGAFPTGCLVDATTNRIFVANNLSGSLSVIDGNTATVATTIVTGANPAVGTLDRSLNILAVLNEGASSVSIFALDTLVPLGTATTGASPSQSIIDSVGRVMYVSNGTGNTVAVISLHDFQVKQLIPTGNNPQGMAQYFQNIYVAEENGGAASNVSVIKRFDLNYDSDLSGDGKADLTWKNISTGSVSAWLMDGVTTTSGAYLLGSGTWSPVLTGDLNGDGKADIIWHNTSTNQNVYWLMNGLGALTSGTFTQGTAAFMPIGIGTCAAQLVGCVFWNDNGQSAASVFFGSGLSQVTYGLAPWQIVGIGNFDGDFYSDIVWQHPDGRVSIWLLGPGVQPTATQVILGPGTNWFPDIIADFDGDGRSDILWRNAATGDTAIWLMNGFAPKPNGAAIIMSGATGWRVDHARDLDGDQKADLIWRNINTGQTAVWLMNGLAPKANGAAIIFSDPNWTVMHARDLNGDLKADLVWRNSVTGATSVWLMDGLSVTNAAIIQESADWIVAPLDP